MRLIKEKTSIDFLGRSAAKIALGLSLLFVIVSLASLATRGLEFGIDFTGGILLEVGYEEAANLERIRGDLIARATPVHRCSALVRTTSCWCACRRKTAMSTKFARDCSKHCSAGEARGAAPRRIR